MVRVYFIATLFLVGWIGCASNAENSEKEIVERHSSQNAGILDTISPTLPQSIDSTKLVYSWLTNYSIENTLVNRVPDPAGYYRIKQATDSYGNWLRHLPLKPGKPNVKLYDKSDKWNQSMHIAVVDMDVDEKDLQQCADAVMRLRAEYFYQKGDYSSIHFNYTNGASVNFNKWKDHVKPVPVSGGVVWKECRSCNSSYTSFRAYLIQIFNYAGTISLERELHPKAWTDMEIGDVVIWGGSPGHAIAVVDIAVNPETGDKAFLLAQSFMPAQESHILKNPNNAGMSPWYSVEDISGDFITPEWLFDYQSLRGWTK